MCIRDRFFGSPAHVGRGRARDSSLGAGFISPFVERNGLAKICPKNLFRAQAKRTAHHSLATPARGATRWIEARGNKRPAKIHFHLLVCLFGKRKPGLICKCHSEFIVKTE